MEQLVSSLWTLADYLAVAVVALSVWMHFGFLPAVLAGMVSHAAFVYPRAYFSQNAKHARRRADSSN
jgi:hypothetical protein